MPQLNVLEAKNNLSSMLRALEEGRESDYVIARAGVPVARLVPLDPQPATWRIGAARGEKLVADGYDIDAPDDEVVALFGEA